jgi:substrate import-associated zinc metallohydrolase lipoprotein
MKQIYILLLALTVGISFSSCASDDDPSGDSIFKGTPVNRDNLDTWLLLNYTYPSNIDFKYKMEDIESDMKYHLVPADSAKAAKLAIIVKYLWMDAYNEVTSPDFIKSNVPRQIHLIGSPAYNSEGTMVLGTAEGGLKVTLYMVNSLTPEMLADYATLTEYYFHTMHHEFTHILNQKKPYNPDYNRITEKYYISGDWYQYDVAGDPIDPYALHRGFISAYSMSEGLEDFAEMLSMYVTSPASLWESLLKEAEKGETGLDLGKGVTGRTIIEQKLGIVRRYMQDYWNIDITALRDAVNRRGTELGDLDLEHLN